MEHHAKAGAPGQQRQEEKLGQAAHDMEPIIAVPFLNGRKDQKEQGRKVKKQDGRQGLSGQLPAEET